MRLILGSVAFIVWMLVTLALALSVVGLLIIMMMDEEWFDLGNQLVKVFQNPPTT